MSTQYEQDTVELIYHYLSYYHDRGSSGIPDITIGLDRARKGKFKDAIAHEMYQEQLADSKDAIIRAIKDENIEKAEDGIGYLLFVGYLVRPRRIRYEAYNTTTTIPFPHFHFKLDD